MSMLIQQGTAQSMLVWAAYGQDMLTFPGYAPPVSYKTSTNGAAYAVSAGSIGAAIGGGNGPYAVQVTLDVTETAVLGDLTIILEDAGGNVVGSRSCQIVPWNPYDGAALGLTHLDAAVSAVADLILDQASAIDTGLTPRECLRLLAAALAGRIAISGTTVTIRDTANAKNRIVATVDGTGQRTTLAYDLS